MKKFWDVILNIVDVIADTAYVIFEVCITLLIIGGMLVIDLILGISIGIALWEMNKFIFGLYIAFIVCLLIVGAYWVLDEALN